MTYLQKKKRAFLSVVNQNIEKPKVKNLINIPDGSYFQERPDGIAYVQHNPDPAVEIKPNTDYTLASEIENMLKNTKTPSQELIDAYNAISMDATAYTVKNPPPITGANVEGSNGDGDSGEEGSDGDSLKIPWSQLTNEQKFNQKFNSIYTESDQSVKDFISYVLKPKMMAEEMDVAALQKFLIKNSSKYDLEVDDIKNIYVAACEASDLPEPDTTWVGQYKNSGWFGTSLGKGVVERYK